ncbi:MAG TPA: tetratricopeptide repeat protein [Bryobacteraceae bacterium]|nr:tetratricopeptide repeat protein [Bryobacteraceae bacterium]
MKTARLLPLFLVITSVASGAGWAELVRRGSELAAAGDLAGAREAFRRALAGDDARVVPAEALATVWSDIGVLSHRLEAFHDALAAYGRARHIIEQAFGPDDWRLIGVLLNAATAYLDQARFAEADRSSARAESILDAQPARDKWLLMRCRIVRAGVLMGRGEAARAAALLQDALSAAGASPDRAVEAAAILNNLAVISAHRSDWTAARMYVERSVALVEAAGPVNDTELIRPLLNAAHVATMQRRHADAVAVLARALAITDAQPGIGAAVRAHILNGYAAALRNVGRKDEARQAAARARAAGTPGGAETVDIYTLSVQPRR